MNPFEAKQFKKMIERVSKYNVDICNCEFGPHLDYKPDEDGEWIKTIDIKTILELFKEE